MTIADATQNLSKVTFVSIMDRVLLLEEFRLIERSENEVSGTWKGVHLLLFFLAFVFGSFCTFCFHMLMYLFDEKCVLFPKLLSLTSLRHNVIYEFIPEEKDKADMLPVDFVSTQWVEKSACYLPTFVPLVSGIFGLVWTSMFLMCTTGTRTLSGLQRPWRMVPMVFVFSLAMSGLCIYSSTVTHYGLQELCVKLGEITGTSTCSYTVNVATLAYERRIRGVYQATRLTIISAWLHTACWLLSAVLALARILLVVDFQLVRISVELQGDLDKMLENHEKQIRTVSPRNEYSFETSNENILSSDSNTTIHFQNKSFDTEDSLADVFDNLSIPADVLHYADEIPRNEFSEMSLVPEEQNKLARIGLYKSLPKDKQFIAKLVSNFVDSIDLSTSSGESSTSSKTLRVRDPMAIGRQYGQETIPSKTPVSQQVNEQEAESVAIEIKRQLIKRIQQTLKELPTEQLNEESPSTSKKRGHIAFDSTMTAQIKRNLQERLALLQDAIQKEETKGITKKSKLKHIGIQTDHKKKKAKKRKQKVTISESKSTYIDTASGSAVKEDKNDEENKNVKTDNNDEEDKNKDDKFEVEFNDTEDKETQTRPKEKQD